MTVLTGCDFEYGGRVAEGGSICVGVDVLCLTRLVGLMIVLLGLFERRLVMQWGIGDGLFERHGFTKERRYGFISLIGWIHLAIAIECHVAVERPESGGG